MKLYVRTQDGKSFTVDAEEKDAVADLKRSIEVAGGVSMSAMSLECQGKTLDDDNATLVASGVAHGAHIGLLTKEAGVRTKVHMMTPHLPCGDHVFIEVPENARKHVIMRALAEKTGVPVEHQIIRMGGINSIFMGDARTNIRSARCGTVDSVRLATTGKL
ncbi:unnamed protein product [Pedinophyceae sp. YPF-701]|nr:unnamed protein product [Pedinophyceae sp. YPF-701]